MCIFGSLRTVIANRGAGIFIKCPVGSSSDRYEASEIYTDLVAEFRDLHVGLKYTGCSNIKISIIAFIHFQSSV